MDVKSIASVAANGSVYDAFSAEQVRKRKRSVNVDEYVLPDDADDRPKARRVNPHHLAARLGPDLVREMEVYIKPGAYMPSFAIRKDLQERYSVDRRHLYDYFHSRGLRVAKEERFNNLARSRQKKLEEKAMLGAGEGATELGGTKRLEHARKRPSQPDRQALSQISTNRIITSKPTPLKKENRQLPSDSSKGHARHIAATRLSAHPISTTDCKPDEISHVHSTVTLCDHPLGQVSVTPAASFSAIDLTIDPRDIFLPPTLPDSQPAEIYDVTQDPEGPYAPSIVDIDTLLPLLGPSSPSFPILPDEESLYQEHVKRASMYDLIQESSFSPSHTGESRGSYKTYMKERKDTFFNGLLSSYEDPSTLNPSSRQRGTLDEFECWLKNDDHDTHLAGSKTSPSAMALPHSSGSTPSSANVVHQTNGWPPLDPPCDIHSLIPKNLSLSQRIAPLLPVTNSFDPQRRSRRCSISSAGALSLARLRTVSAGGHF